MELAGDISKQNDSAIQAVQTLIEEESKSVIAPKYVVERLIIALLANGNVLVEGLPGLAKTRSVKSVAKTLEADLSRIQFTPDLLPSDITGTEIFVQEASDEQFRFQQYPTGR